MNSEKRELWTQIAQCAVSFGLGAPAYLWVPPDNPFERLLAALIAGFGGLWLLTFLWVWLRHGWKAARSLTMSPGG